MDKNRSPKPEKGQQKKGFVRSQEDIDLKSKLLSSPELFITEKGSDEHLDRLQLKIQLLGNREFILEDFVSDLMQEYEVKFSKEWFYRLADLYSVPRNLMDPYVKPLFVKEFIIEFVYGRFPNRVLGMLRRNKALYGSSKQKLFQYLTKEASARLDSVIGEVFETMNQSTDPLDFKMKYSQKFKVYFQTELF